MKTIYPSKLKKGDTVRIIAPARSFSILGEDLVNIANTRFKDLGLNLTFGKNLKEIDEFGSSSIKSRLADFHEAFLDKTVNAIFTVIGGYNSNQLLNLINCDIVKNNPKIFCGYSDITVLNNAIFAKTGLVTYSGPHYSSFGQKLHLDYTLDYFNKCLFNKAKFEILPSQNWSDDLWWKDQDQRVLNKNLGYWIINKGKARGTILGGNLDTFNLLCGTKYFPNLNNSLLFLEDDSGSNPYLFDRELQSLIHQTNFESVGGIVIGRFQKESGVSFELLGKILETKPELKNIPIIGNVDFGHTDPKITFPIGGKARIEVQDNKVSLVIEEH